MVVAAANQDGLVVAVVAAAVAERLTVMRVGMAEMLPLPVSPGLVVARPGELRARVRMVRKGAAVAVPMWAMDGENEVVRAGLPPVVPVQAVVAVFARQMEFRLREMVVTVRRMAEVLSSSLFAVM